jgi:hypothetical protein
VLLYASLSIWALPRSSLFSAPGRSVETVPLSLAVSATPSPFLLLPSSLEICDEWCVSLLERPSCLPDVSLELLGLPRGSACRC